VDARRFREPDAGREGGSTDARAEWERRDGGRGLALRRKTSRGNGALGEAARVDTERDRDGRAGLAEGRYLELALRIARANGPPAVVDRPIFRPRPGTIPIR
jgi:hypothetical protein